MSYLGKLFLTCATTVVAVFAIDQRAGEAGPEIDPSVPVYSLRAKSFPSAVKVTSLANLAQAERVTFAPADPPSSAIDALLKRIAEKCGWPDPAILVWVAKRQGNEQLGANQGSFNAIPASMPLKLYLPSCVYLSASQVTLQAALSDEPINNLIPSGSVRDFVSSNAKDINNSISTLPVDKRLGTVQGRDVLVNIEPSIKETEAVSQTSNAQEAIKIASALIHGAINDATYEERRRALFTRIVQETANQVLGDPGKRPAISRAGIRPSDKQKIAFVSGTTFDDVKHELGDAFAITDEAPIASLEYDPDDPGAAAAAEECKSGLGSGSNRIWPLPVHRIIDVLEMNHFQRVKRTVSDRVDPTPVLVADTGYPALLLNQIQSHWDDVAADPGFHFPKEALLTVQGKQGGAKDKVGADVTRETTTYEVDPPKANEYGAAHHGMWVGSLILGGFNLGFFRSDRALPIQIHFAKLLTRKSDNSEFIISRDAISRAVQYAFEHNINVINWSVSTTDELSDLEKFLERTPEGKRLLFVSAAGEDGLDLRTDGRWPARYGGDPANAPAGTTFITVGAIRADGQPYTRSNRGGDFVDLLAPGCSLLVPEVTMSGSKMQMGLVPRSGTSFSAPIVTFVSALLVAEGLTPPQVKTRLTVSATHRPDVRAYAMQGSVLDPVAALSVYHDFVELADGTEIKGYLTDDTVTGPAINTCDHGDGGLISANAILSIDQGGTAQDRTITFYVTPDLETRVHYRVISCKGEEANFANDLEWKIRRLESGEVVPFKLKDVKRFVRRAFTSNPNQ
jgi:subtilisin family serine protease